MEKSWFDVLNIQATVEWFLKGFTLLQTLTLLSISINLVIVIEKSIGNVFLSFLDFLCYFKSVCLYFKAYNSILILSFKELKYF